MAGKHVSETWALPAANHRVGPGRITLGQRASRSEPLLAGQQWRRLGSYALALILEGRGTYRDEAGYACGLGPGSLITVLPELGHRYGPDGDGWTETFLVFSGPVFEAWEAAGELDGREPVARLCDTDYWRERFEWVLGGQDVFAEEADFDPLLQIARLQVLMAEIRGALRRPANDGSPLAPRPPAWLAQAKELLARQPHNGKPPELEAIADELCVSYSTFRRRFVEHVGVSPARYRAEQLMDRARRLMIDTDLNDKQIADRLGFADAQHFSKRFKQIIGQTPSRFRVGLR